MRALYLDGPTGTLTLKRDYPAPTLKQGEVIIRPSRMGVCSTDLELARGYMGYTGVLGHEFVGIVEQATDAQGEAWLGKRVVGTINCPTKSCDLLPILGPEHARHRTVLGILNRDGCFADQFTLPVTNLLEVPDHLEDDAAVFTEPVAAALQILEQMTVQPNQRVAVLGDGRLGLLCAQVLSQTGAHVCIVGKHHAKLQHAQRWGLETIQHHQVEPAMDHDIVVDCTGSRSGVTTAMRLLKPRGVLILKTTTATPKPNSNEPHLDLSLIVINELQVIGSRCGPFAKALKALHEQRIEVLPLIGKRMTLEDGPSILEAAKTQDVVKTILTP